MVWRGEGGDGGHDSAPPQARHPCCPFSGAEDGGPHRLSKAAAAGAGPDSAAAYAQAQTFGPGEDDGYALQGECED